MSHVPFDTLLLLPNKVKRRRSLPSIFVPFASNMVLKGGGGRMCFSVHARRCNFCNSRPVQQLCPHCSFYRSQKSLNSQVLLLAGVGPCHERVEEENLNSLAELYLHRPPITAHPHHLCPSYQQNLEDIMNRYWGKIVVNCASLNNTLFTGQNKYHERLPSVIASWFFHAFSKKVLGKLLYKGPFKKFQKYKPRSFFLLCGHE